MWQSYLREVNAVLKAALPLRMSRQLIGKKLSRFDCFTLPLVRR